MADMSPEEYSSSQLTPHNRDDRPRSEDSENYVDESTPIPDSVDWVDEGAVTPIKDQGQCGSCWTFSTTGAIEGANFIKNGVLVSLSEQMIIDCDHDEVAGCDGG